MSRDRSFATKLFSFLVAIALLCSLAVFRTPALAQVASFSITASVENSDQGSISPAGSVVVNGGGSMTFVVTPNPGYKVGFVLVDGKSQGTVSSFTFTNVSSNHTISAGFSRMTYTITASSGPNGVISPASMTLVEHGNTQTFTITPNTGYKIADVVVDDWSVGAVSTYTFTNVQSSRTISVTFAALNPGGEPTSSPSGPGITELAGSVGQGGVFLRDVTAFSGDNRVSVTVREGTSVRLAAGQGLYRIEIAARPGSSQQPGVVIVGDAYDIMPDSATFDTPAGLSMEYDPARVPAGSNEADLALAVRNQVTGDWDLLPGSVAEASDDFVYAPISLFGRYAVVAREASAAFTVADLDISPRELRLGGSATAAVTVTNTGYTSGSYRVTLKIDGSDWSFKDVNLGAGASERIEFSLPGNVAGAFKISVGDLSSALLVAAPLASVGTPSSGGWSFSFGLVPGLISAAALVVVLVLTIVRRRRSTMTEAATFSLKDLEITPKELRVGGRATVAVTVVNDGGRAGSFRVWLKVNGSVAGARDVTLARGMSDRIQFSVPTSSTGLFAVSVEDLSGTFTVIEAPSGGFGFQSA